MWKFFIELFRDNCYGEYEENVRNDDNIIVYKIGLVKKIGDEYELESYGAIKKYESIDVMREK